MFDRVWHALIVGFVWFFVSGCIIGIALTLAVVDSDFVGYTGLTCAGLLGALAGWRDFRKSEPSDGVWRCRECGYNLRGNTSGVCPECGNRIGP